jgi:hypothetical protein
LGALAPYSSTFLRAFAVLTLIPFSVPIMLASLQGRACSSGSWMRADLELYFGRCLGVVASAAFGYRSAMAGHARAPCERSLETTS